jgi:hypothetical protein
MDGALKTDHRWLVVLCLYFLMATSGTAEVLTSGQGLCLLINLLVASTATTWAVLDSLGAGRPLLHSVQFVIFISWPVALPIYLVSTRGLRGLGLSCLNAIGLIATFAVFFLATVFAMYGLHAFSGE